MAASVIALVACSASSGGTAGSGTSTPAVDDPKTKAVLSAYTAYWDAVITASNPANPEAKALADHAVAPELDRVKVVLAARKKAAEKVKGTYSHDAKVASLTGTTALVTDCLTMKTSSFDAKTGKLKRKDPAGPFSVEVKLALQGQSWKVADIGTGKAACTPVPNGSRANSPTGA